MLLHDSLTATVTRESFLHVLAPLAQPVVEDIIGGFALIIQEYDEMRRWFY